MPRIGKTGVRGLFREVRYFAGGKQIKTANAGPDTKKVETWRIDIRWRDSTNRAHRYAERLPGSVTTTAAKHRARELLNSAYAGKLGERKAAPPTIGAALDAYLTWSETNTPRSIGSKRSQVKTLKTGLGESLRVDELSAFAVEKFKRKRIRDLVKKEIWTNDEQQAHAATVNRALATLKHMVSLSPTLGIEITAAVSQAIGSVKLLKEPPGRVRELSQDEEAKLFDELPVGVAPIVRASMLSGMRRAEVVLLKKEAVDLANRVITLTRTKSGKVRRIPINETLASLLTTAIAASKCDHVFSTRAAEPYTVDAVSRAFSRACKKAKIVDLRFHDGRHHFATAVRRAGAGIDGIQHLLGHATMAMSQRYAHVGADMLAQAVGRLDPVAAALPQESTVPTTNTQAPGGVK